MDDLIFALWFFLPAGIGNMAPVVAAFFREGKPVHQGFFGSHKTWQGLIVGTLAGGIAFIIQQQIWPSEAPWLTGFFLGFGAIAGDMTKSYFKRRVGIQPGDPWPPFDQFDYAVGAIVFSLPFIILPFLSYVFLLIVYATASLVVNHIAFWIGMRGEPL